MRMILFLTFLSLSSFAQNCPQYDSYLKKGDEYFKQENYHEALIQYKSAQIEANKCQISVLAVDDKIKKAAAAEEKERKRIAADLHDGVGQLMTAAWLNLQVLEKQTTNGTDEQQQLINKTTLLVGESCKEVRQVSHNMMPNALLKKGLINAVKEFTQQIDSSILSINLQAEGLDVELDSITETILYRVIQESVNNAIKHAAASELDISIHHANGNIDVLIEDNGQGFDIKKIDNNKNGLGLQNIRSRILFLKGTVDWDSSPSNGTVVAIHIPPKK